MTNEITFDGLTVLGTIAGTVQLATMTPAAVIAADAVVVAKLVKKIVGADPT